MGLGKLWLFLDPTFLFGVSCYVTVLFIQANGKTHEIKPRAFDLNLAKAHMTDPTVIVSVVLTLLALLMTWNVNVDKLKGSTMRRAGWYLWNACLFHVMDGMVGMGFAPVLAENYEFLDIRMRSLEFEHGGPHPGEENLAHMIVMLEIFFMTPLCLLCYVAVVGQKKWAQEAEILLCTVHLLGTLMWIVPPIMDQCRGLAPIGQPGCFPHVGSLFNLFFFYFGSGVNLVWILVPARYLVQAIMANYRYKMTGQVPNDTIETTKKTKSL